MNTKPLALLRNTTRVFVGTSRLSGRPVFQARCYDGTLLELRGDAATSDHYAALVAEFGDDISKLDSPDAKPNFIEFNTGRQYTPEGQKIEAWIVAVDSSTPDFPIHLVYFKDTSRMIDGYVRVCRLTEQEVMTEYDNGRYRAA